MGEAKRKRVRGGEKRGERRQQRCNRWGQNEQHFVRARFAHALTYVHALTLSSVEYVPSGQTVQVSGSMYVRGHTDQP